MGTVCFYMLSSFEIRGLCKNWLSYSCTPVSLSVPEIEGIYATGGGGGARGAGGDPFLRMYL